MGATWVLVMSQSQMKLFESVDDKYRPLRFLKTLRNSLVQYRSKEVTRHKPGMITGGGRRGVAHHVMNAGISPHNLTTDAFARRMAAYIESARKRNDASNFIVIAEPKLMGRVKKKLSQETLRMVETWIPKDLEKATTTMLLAAMVRANKSPLARLAIAI